MSLKNIFADYTSRSFMPGTSAVPVADEQAAVRHALDTHALYFKTYEVESVTVGNKTFSGAPENWSERYYVGIDKVYTQAEVLKSFDDRLPEAIRQDRGVLGAQSITQIFNNVKACFAKDAPDTSYLAIERPGEFTRLKAGEKVYDSAGKLVWSK